MTQFDFKELKSKAAFSNIVSEEQVIRRYKGLAIVKSPRGFNSEEEIDAFVKSALQEQILERLSYDGLFFLTNMYLSSDE